MLGGIPNLLDGGDKAVGVAAAGFGIDEYKYLFHSNFVAYERGFVNRGVTVIKR